MNEDRRIEAVAEYLRTALEPTIGTRVFSGHGWHEFAFALLAAATTQPDPLAFLSL